MRAGYVVDKHTFSVNTASGSLTATAFDLVAAASVQNDINTMIRKDEEHEFYI